ncbi:MAG: spermidine synthase [Burkholderiaceae bacterium]|jgi:spermidine synthase|nr:spermidine synthase [Burkholderiaceae bacterium]
MRSLPEATISEQDGVRYLHLDTPWVQGAMLLKQPRTLVLEYVQRMMAWMLWRAPEGLAQGRAVQLGLGAAAITRFTRQVLRMPTTAVELNPAVIAACRRWFRLPDDDALLSVRQADAATWLRSDEAPRGEVSVLCVDLYDHEAAAPVLDDEAFYADCRALLAEGGLMTVNLFGRRASFGRSMARIAAAFGPQHLWHLLPTREGNTIAVATHTVPAPDRGTLLARADNIESRYGLPARKWLRLVRPWQPQAPPDR